MQTVGLALTVMRFLWGHFRLLGDLLFMTETPGDGQDDTSAAERIGVNIPFILSR
jgi:hypothetical protein